MSRSSVCTPGESPMVLVTMEPSVHWRVKGGVPSTIINENTLIPAGVKVVEVDGPLVMVGLRQTGQATKLVVLIWRPQTSTPAAITLLITAETPESIGPSVPVNGTL